MKNLFTIAFIITLLLSCDTNNTRINERITPKTDFQQYVDSIPTLDLPYEFSSSDEMIHFDNPKSQVPEGAMLMGKLPSLDNVHLIIYSYPADIRLPVLEVYDNDGKKRSETPLLKYNCLLDLNWQSSFVITEDYDIYMNQVCGDDNSSTNRDTVALTTLLQEKSP